MAPSIHLVCDALHALPLQETVPSTEASLQQSNYHSQNTTPPGRQRAIYTHITYIWTQNWLELWPLMNNILTGRRHKSRTTRFSEKIQPPTIREEKSGRWESIFADFSNEKHFSVPTVTSLLPKLEPGLLQLKQKQWCQFMEPTELLRNCCI